MTNIAAVCPAAPNQATTQAKLQELQALVAGRNEADLQQIAYRNGSSPFYWCIEIAFAQNRFKPASTQQHWCQDCLC